MLTVQSWLQNIVNVTEEEHQAINEIIETTHVKANETIIKQGQISTRIGFLLRGAIRTYFTDSEGNHKIVAFAFEGDPVAIIDSFLNQVPSAVTAVTLEPSTIIWTDHQRFTAFMNQYPRYNTVILTALTNWFADGKNRMEYLLKSAAKDKYEIMCKLHPKINERVPLKYIASYLGITQATLSRIRGKK
jgi:CRP-like cAMP-binding protein